MSKETAALVRKVRDRLESWRDSHIVWERQHNRSEDRNAAENYDHLAKMLTEALHHLEVEAHATGGNA